MAYKEGIRNTSGATIKPAQDNSGKSIRRRYGGGKLSFHCAIGRQETTRDPSIADLGAKNSTPNAALSGG